MVGHTNGELDGNSNSGSYDLFLVKYNSSGTKQWTKQLGTSSREGRWKSDKNGVTVNSSNIYVVGYTEGGLDGNSNAGDKDVYLVKYNSSGTKQWTRQLGTTYDEMATGGVATDSSGNIYIAGTTTGGLDGNTNSGSSDMFLVKYNSLGTKQWTQQLGSASMDPPQAIVVDGSDNIYVAGQNWGGGLDGETHSGGLWADIYLVKYNTSGAKQWTKQIGTTSLENCSGVAADSNGNVYITGSTQGDLDGETNSYNSDMYLIKYNSSGTKQWTKLLGADSSSDEDGKAITTDSSNNIFITGTTEGTFSDNTNYGQVDMFLVKYNDSGTKQWTKQFGTSSSDYGTGIVIDSAGNTYMSGYTSGSFDGNTNAGGIDLFLLKFDSSGTKQ